MLPPINTLSPWFFKISWVNNVVVVFPLVPVTAIIGFSVNFAANSISLITFILFFKANLIFKLVFFTPGLKTIVEIFF